MTARPAVDELDVPAVHAWLVAHVDGLSVPPPQVTRFSGGASNLTYRLRYPDRDLVLRRPPVGTKPSSGHDMAREYRVQQALKPFYRYVPTVRALCREPSVIGSDFYVMDLIPGTILRRDLPEGMRLDAARAHGLSETFVHTLVELHNVDVTAAGLSTLGKGDGYVARQVAGWTERYRRARTPNTPTFDRVAAWLDEHQPADSGTCLIHNDFRLDNLVLDPDQSEDPNDSEDPNGPPRVVGVLDWEMATLGDPLMDLAGALAYWAQADDDPVARAIRRQPTTLPGMLTRADIVERYCALTGRPAHDWPFYEVFGLFRLAVILQQIYYRYYHRQTARPPFRGMWLLVGYLDWRCRRAIRSAGSR